MSKVVDVLLAKYIISSILKCLFYNCSELEVSETGLNYFY